MGGLDALGSRLGRKGEDADAAGHGEGLRAGRRDEAGRQHIRFRRERLVQGSLLKRARPIGDFRLDGGDLLDAEHRRKGFGFPPTRDEVDQSGGVESFEGLENLPEIESQGIPEGGRRVRSRNRQMVEDLQIDRRQELAGLVPTVERPRVVTDDDTVGKSGWQHRLVEHGDVSLPRTIVQVFQEPFQERT